MKNKLNKTLGLTTAVIAGASVLPLATAQAEEVVIPVPEQAKENLPKTTQEDVNKAGEVYNKAQTELDSQNTSITDKTEKLQGSKKNSEENQALINKIPELKENFSNQEKLVDNDKARLDQLKNTAKPRAESDLAPYKTERENKAEDLKTKEQDIKATQNKIDDKKKEIQNLEETVPSTSSVEKDITSTQSGLTTKRREKSTLDKEVSDLDKTIQEKIEELKNYKPGVNVEVKKIVTPGDDELSVRPEPMEVIDFKGRKTEILPYNPNFKPDNKEVAKFFLEYLNELKEINGIEPVVLSEEMMKVAEIRANELIGNFSHSSASGARYVAENIGGSAGKEYFSNREIAYEMLIGWFSDYSNVAGYDYGHRTNLLRSKGNIGVGVSVKNSSVYFAFDTDDTHIFEMPVREEWIDGKIIYRFNTHWLEDKDGEPVKVTKEEYLNNYKDKGYFLSIESSAWDIALGKFVPTGKYYVDIPGQQAKFIDNITFKYVVETPGEDKTTELKANLDKLLSQQNVQKTRQNKVAGEITVLENKLADLEKGKADIQTLIENHKSRIETERQALTNLQTDLKTQTDLKNKTQADLDVLDAKIKPLVEELNKIEKEIELGTQKLGEISKTLESLNVEYNKALTVQSAQPKLIEEIKKLEQEIKDLQLPLKDLENKRNTTLENYKRVQIEFLLRQEGLKPFVLDLPGVKEPRLEVPKTAPTAEVKPELSLDLFKTEKTNTQNSVTQVTTKPQGNTEKVLPKTSAKNTGANNSLPLGLAGVLLGAGLLTVSRKK